MSDRVQTGGVQKTRARTLEFGLLEKVLRDPVICELLQVGGAASPPLVTQKMRVADNFASVFSTVETTDPKDVAKECSKMMCNHSIPDSSMQCEEPTDEVLGKLVKGPERSAPDTACHSFWLASRENEKHPFINEFIQSLIQEKHRILWDSMRITDDTIFRTINFHELEECKDFSDGKRARLCRIQTKARECEAALEDLRKLEM
ncbi:hypothetical protein CYMTET_31813 [Cymbomonas tetramitiformis]|uniref:Uncharacterized protein n=1 Tax=Cymbomonas tetramitiformis TaxID=36881 RepID=A0AAE0FGT3_9CHLO|nr:hypothetical protein CYMTET_31813 [Cymbomonas tetramitiformis]